MDVKLYFVCMLDPWYMHFIRAVTIGISLSSARSGVLALSRPTGDLTLALQRTSARRLCCACGWSPVSVEPFAGMTGVLASPSARNHEGSAPPLLPRTLRVQPVGL